MKIILSSRRHHYVARVSAFLITVALIAGMIGCGGPGVIKYDLIISSAAGGSVTVPTEGTFTYDIGTVVSLAATPATGYQFVNWTGDVGTIANVNAASTTITMNDSYSITANFEAIPADHYILTISSTTEGLLLCGNITTPGEGTFIYSSGTVVNLVAQAEEGCQFVDWTGDVGTIADVNVATTTITMNGDYSIRANFRPYASPMVAAGADRTVGLKLDGAVIAVGINDYGQCTNASSWTNIIQVAAGNFHTLGLKADGTVIAVGNNAFGQCDVCGWTNIVQIAAGSGHTVGLRADGTVVAAGDNFYGQCNVDTRSWKNIIRIAAGSFHTVGLRADGTVVAAGDNSYGQCNVGSWTNIIQVAAGSWHTVGLKADGTAVAAGNNSYGQCNVGDCSTILQVAAGYFYTVVLLSSGTVVAVGDNPYGQCDVCTWTNIIRIAAGWRHTVGLKADGTVIAVGNNGYGQCNVGRWDLF
jgi:uncharacterized repeat protein (TIGR02543 family)